MMVKLSVNVSSKVLPGPPSNASNHATQVSPKASSSSISMKIVSKSVVVITLCASGQLTGSWTAHSAWSRKSETATKLFSRKQSDNKPPVS